MKTKEQYEIASICKHFNMDSLRIGQRGAINCILDRMQQKMPTTSIVLPTRYGKSDVIRVSAIEAKLRHMVSTTVVLVPNRVLSSQMIDDDAVQSMIQRHKAHFPREIETFALNANNQTQFMQQYPALATATIQWANLNCANLVKWVKKTIRKGYAPPHFVIDESHLNSTENSWGASIAALQEAGAYTTLVTGTPMRSDGKPIPGFKTVVLSEEETKVFSRRQSETDPDKHELMTYLAGKSTVKLVPDYERTYREAWDEGVICFINRIGYDCMTKTEALGERLLSTVTVEADCRRALKLAITNNEGIEKGLTLMAECFDRKRKRYPTYRIQGLIFCGNDDTEAKSDSHIRRVERKLTQMYPHLKFRVATSDDDGAKQNIEDFRNGHFDILIVKQMAGVGLDVPALKIVLDLSSVRQPAAMIQRLMRCATLHGEVIHGDYITPDDPLGLIMFQALVEDEGGCQTHIEKKDLVSITEIDPETDTPPDEMWVSSFIDGIVIDSNGSSASYADQEYLDAFLRCVPTANVSYSEAIKIAKQMWKDGIPVEYRTPVSSPNSGIIVNSSQLLASARSERADLMKQLISKLIRYDPAKKEEYQMKIKEVHRGIAEHLMLDLNRSWKDLTLEQNKQIIVLLKQMLSHNEMTPA